LSLAELSTDGGRRECGKGAAAFSLRNDSKLYKVVCLLDQTSVDRAELIALVLGLTAAELLNIEKIEWTSDSQVIVSGAMDRLEHWQSNNWKKTNGDSVSSRDLWQLVSTSSCQLVGLQDSQSAEVLKCHKACDWIIEKGEQFFGQEIEGFLVKNSHQKESHSWFLIDGRELFNNPLGSSIEEVMTATLEKFKKKHLEGN
jgi:ribonuclease HI